MQHRSEEHTSELQSHSDLHSFPTRRSSDLSGNSSTAQVQGVFSWKGLNDRSWSNSTNLPVQCPVGAASPVPCTFTFPQTIQVYLAPGAQLRVGVNATQIGRAHV